MALTVAEFRAKVAANKENPPVKKPPGDSLGDLGDALEQLADLPKMDGFVFLAGVPRRLGLRKR